MHHYSILQVLFVGIISGFASGALGLTSAPIIVPLLTLLKMVESYKVAIGTTLFAVLPPLSIGAVYTYYKHKQVNVRLGLILMVIVALASYGGGKFTETAHPRTIAYITSALLLFLSSFWFYCAHTGKYIGKK
ncbi:TSUP family transporter [Crocinitomicaceae bacterium]|nr:TSUP family transporter [Crocinitomicaceae bacterium]